jgi:SMI1/KNR4 family protein SUKH-1
MGRIAMRAEEDRQDIWSHLRAYRDDLSAPIPPGWDWYGLHTRARARLFAPATEEQLRATEERLGLPLPSDLRRLYTEITDGALNFGPVEVFRGAEDLASESSDWRLHPRIGDALLRHPGSYVIVDSLPQDFLYIGGGHNCGDIAIDMLTGRLYDLDYWDDLPDVVIDNAPFEPLPFQLQYIQLAAPSLGVWFERWLDNRWLEQFSDHTRLFPEMVESGDLPDPDAVWRGLYRFGPRWHFWEQQPDDTDAAYDAQHAIYWTYVDDAD